MSDESLIKEVTKLSVGPGEVLAVCVPESATTEDIDRVQRVLLNRFAQAGISAPPIVFHQDTVSFKVLKA